MNWFEKHKPKKNLNHNRYMYSIQAVRPVIAGLVYALVQVTLFTITNIACANTLILSPFAGNRAQHLFLFSKRKYVQRLTEIMAPKFTTFL